MNGFLFLFAIASLLVAGVPALALTGYRIPGAPGRAAILFASGTVFAALEMFLLSWAGIGWSVPLLAALFFVPAAASLRRLSYEQAPAHQPPFSERFTLVAVIAGLLLFAWACATARATSTDLLLFWGTKGVHFAMARGIDVPFLSEAFHIFLHPDYPPLLPLLYAWGALAAGRFPWGASLLLAPMFLSFSAAAFWSFSRGPLGDSKAARMTLVLVFLLGFGMTFSECAGNAEAPLLFFETIALSLWLFGTNRAEVAWLVSIALAGAVLIKFEGTVFAALFLAAAGFGLRKELHGSRLFVRLAAFPGASLALWLFFCRSHHLLDNYRGGNQGPVTFANLGTVASVCLQEASFGAFYAPWIGLLLLWGLAPNRRKGIAPAVIAAAWIAANVFFYLHGARNPTLWIRWSASRVYLTALLCLFFAIAASQLRDPAGNEKAGHSGPA